MILRLIVVAREEVGFLDARCDSTSRESVPLPMAPPSNADPFDVFDHLYLAVGGGPENQILEKLHIGLTVRLTSHGPRSVPRAIEEKDDALEFSIIDNGEGLVSDRIDISRKNLGLARMVDYAELLNAQLRIFSDLERGTQVVLSIPYQAL